MATVPKFGSRFSSLSSGSVGSHTSPGITANAPNLGAVGKAQEGFGKALQGAGDDFARVGAEMQSQQEDTEAKARLLRYKQDLYDHTYGNEERGIVGLETLNGQAAIDQAPKTKQDLDGLLQKNIGEAASPRVRRQIEPAMAAAQLEASGSRRMFLFKQQMVAERATDNALMVQLQREMLAAPEKIDINKAKTAQLHDLQMKEAQRQGMTGDVAKNFADTAVSKTHLNAITHFINAGKSSEARTYLREYEDQFVEEHKDDALKAINQEADKDQADKASRAIYNKHPDDRRAAFAAVDNYPGVDAQQKDEMRARLENRYLNEDHAVVQERRVFGQRYRVMAENGQDWESEARRNGDYGRIQELNMVTEFDEAAQHKKRPIDPAVRSQINKWRTDYVKSNYSDTAWLEVDLTQMPLGAERDRLEELQAKSISGHQDRLGEVNKGFTTAVSSISKIGAGEVASAMPTSAAARTAAMAVVDSKIAELMEERRESDPNFRPGQMTIVEQRELARTAIRSANRDGDLDAAVALSRKAIKKVRDEDVKAASDAVSSMAKKFAQAKIKGTSGADKARRANLEIAAMIAAENSMNNGVPPQSFTPSTITAMLNALMAQGVETPDTWFNPDDGMMLPMVNGEVFRGVDDEDNINAMADTLGATSQEQVALVGDVMRDLTNKGVPPSFLNVTQELKNREKARKRRQVVTQQRQKAAAIADDQLVKSEDFIEFFPNTLLPDLVDDDIAAAPIQRRANKDLSDLHPITQDIAQSMLSSVADKLTAQGQAMTPDIRAKVIARAAQEDERIRASQGGTTLGEEFSKFIDRQQQRRIQVSADVANARKERADRATALAKEKADEGARLEVLRRQNDAVSRGEIPDQVGGGPGSDSPTSSSNERLVNSIKEAEGGELKSYKDLDARSIGFGFNLDNPKSRGIIEGMGYDFKKVRAGTQNITQAHAEELLTYSVNLAAQDARKIIPRFETLPGEVQEALIEMSYQLGGTKLRKFVDMKKAIKSGKLAQAADAMLDSTWAKQTPARAKKLADILRSAGSV